MKRCMILFLMLTVFACMPASAEYWPHDSSHAVACGENRSGCQVLQMVMMGCFDYSDTPDSLDRRVLSAVLPKLCAVEEAEFAHFCEEFAVEEAKIREFYYIALANCLLSDIQMNPDPGGEETLVRRTLRLFLDPQSEADSDVQMESIREQMTPELAQRMAFKLGVPETFIGYLIGGETQLPQE